MNFFERRRQRKLAQHWRHELRHARSLREDVAAPEDLARLDRAREALDAAAAAGSREALEAACEAAARAVARVRPPGRWPWLAENLEVVVVALAVAMAIRCFFVQPFKIPTGSMQPTLYGITFENQAAPGFWDRFPLNLAAWALFGEGYVEVRARNSGFVAFANRPDADGNWIAFVDRTPHRIRAHMPVRVRRGDFVRRGEVIASGRMRYGDHVLVNKVAYNFRRPRRGDIIVFDTRDIRHPDIRRDTFYIKRLVGLPNERIAIAPPWLVADGEPVTEPRAFRRMAEAAAEGYRGYQFPHPLANPRPALAGPEDVLALGPDQYLPMGDNSGSSLDGRYFGAVPGRSLVGPAFAVYWPLTRRWGPVE